MAENNMYDVRTPPSAPSTPPLFTIPSPDLNTFKSFMKSPAFSDEIQHIELNDMDFEAAYAMLTTTPNSHGIIHQSVPNLNQYKDDINQHLLEVHSKMDKDSLNVSSPPPESGSIFANYELLSAHESSAIEQFLDSIIEDKPIQQSQGPLQTAKTEQLTEPLNIFPVVLNDILPSEDQTEHRESSEEIRSDFKRKLTPMKRKYVKKRKRLLTDEEKKSNHITSEQRRRNVIKQTYDELINLLPKSSVQSNKSKRAPPKSTVLENVANEIERIQRINNELRNQLKNEP